MQTRKRLNRDLLPSPYDYYCDKIDQFKTSGSHKAKGCCPFKAENTPSLFVNLDTGTFKCFSCGLGGDMIAFHMQYHGMGFVDACKDLGAWA